MNNHQTRNSQMKTSILIVKMLSTAALFMVLSTGFEAIAQTSIDDQVNVRLLERSVAGAQLGSLICEDANGKMVLCSGNVEETVLGIATNVPYVTINKPATPDASKFIFNAMVSNENGSIANGDRLMASKGGVLVKCSNEIDGYAIALDDASDKGTIRVKLINR